MGAAPSAFGAAIMGTLRAILESPLRRGFGYADSVGRAALPTPTRNDNKSRKTEGPANVHLCHCEEQSDVAIRISPAPPGPGGALRRRGYGLPQPFGLRNDVVTLGCSLWIGWAMVRAGRRGQCHTPYGINEGKRTGIVGGIRWHTNKRRRIAGRFLPPRRCGRCCGAIFCGWRRGLRPGCS